MKRWLIVLVVLGASLAGGAFVTITSPPRYLAKARVAMEYIKPNPVTGVVVSGKMVDAYVQSQIRAIKDYQVAIPAAEALGLLDNPDLQAAYYQQPGATADEFPRWVARIIMGTINVDREEDSNVLSISSTSSSPQLALQFVETIRNAYVQSDLDLKRAGAAGAAAALSAQSDVIRKRLTDLEAAKATLEGRSGGMPYMEARRLADLVLAARPITYAESRGLPTANRLGTAEMALAEAAKTLGPNHPTLKAMRLQRDMLKAQVEQERVEAANIGGTAGVAERARQAAIDVQEDKVLSQRPLMLQLRILQDQIDSYKQTLTDLTARILEQRQLTALQAGNLTPMGAAEVKPHPVFPNPWLILGGTGFLGLTLGCLLALLTELLNRRVRDGRALEYAVGAALLGSIPRLATTPVAKPKRVGPARSRQMARAGRSAAA